MVGGKEDEYWAQRQREWGAWKAEEKAKWERQQRKEAIRRERDDVNRGHREITATDEEYELRNLNDFDRWEEVTTDDKNKYGN